MKAELIAEKENKRIRKTRQNTGVSFYSLLVSGFVFLAMMVVLCLVQKNVSYHLRPESIPLLTIQNGEVQTFEKKADTLLVWQDDDAGSYVRRMMSDIMNQMKVDFDDVVYTSMDPAQFNNYDKVVLAITDYEYVVNDLVSIRQWVQQGGQLMVAYPPSYSSSFVSFSSLFGIMDVGEEGYTLVEGFHFLKEFMIGGMAKDYKITDPYDSSLMVVLTKDCEVFMESTDQYPIPLIWRRSEGKGNVVFGNMGFMEKAYRGFYSTMYSLLGDTCVYPVINGSTFFIDDFPSPVPAGEGKYITRDYGLSIKDFYTQVWWQDIYRLSQQYQFPFTGLVIEDYSDQVSGTFERQKDTERFTYFGNMLLSAGGEIGLHGYNHMPLVLGNFNYGGMYDSYVQWKSYEDMRNAVSELESFCHSLFPEEQLQVYVPPSNIISEDGIRMLAEDFEGVKSVAAVYIGGELAYEQEFNVSDNGIINTPRIISGYILDEFSDIVALSELNFHFVNTHFQHPDDVLDEDRGAELGWVKMFRNLSDYVEWLYTAAPNLRSLTGSELAAAVQRYDYIDVQRNVTPKGLELNLANFYNEAWLMVRLNRGQQIRSITGASYQEVGQDLYLLNVSDAHVEIELIKD